MPVNDVPRECQQAVKDRSPHDGSAHCLVREAVREVRFKKTTWNCSPQHE
jgi:hypothetical protein